MYVAFMYLCVAYVCTYVYNVCVRMYRLHMSACACARVSPINV